MKSLPNPSNSSNLRSSSATSTRTRGSDTCNFISSMDSCWPNYWGVEIGPLLICLGHQGKQSWGLDIWICLEESLLQVSDECIRSPKLSWVLIKCSGVYPLSFCEVQNCQSAISWVLDSHLRCVLNWKLRVLSHPWVSNEVQTRCNL